MIDRAGDRELLALLDEMRRGDASLEPAADLEARAAARWAASTLTSAPAQVPMAWRAGGRRRWIVAAGVAATVAAGVLVGLGRAAGDARDGEVVPAHDPVAIEASPALAGEFIAVAPDAFDVLRGVAGGVQIARVRVPRGVLADLGVVGDTHRVGEPVQVDVVFGEDGLARAVRVVPPSRRVW